MSEEPEITEELRESYKKYGPLRSVLKTQFGVAAGETRLKAVPEWKFIDKKVADYLEHLKLKAADNIQAVKPAPWWEKLLTEAAREYEKAGTPKEKVAEKMVDDFPVARWRILRYLPDEFKRPGHVEAGKKGGKPAPDLGYDRNLTTRETGESEEKEAESGESQKERPEPYSKTSRSLKDNNPTEFTHATVSFLVELNRRHILPPAEKYIPVNSWSCIVCHSTVKGLEGPTGPCPECNKTAGFEQVQLKADTLLDIAGKRISVEAEGEGTASDDEERDELLAEQGIAVFHAPNDFLEKWGYLFAEFIALVVAE